MALGRFNGWTAVSLVAATALMGFCLAGAAIACRVSSRPVLQFPDRPAVAHAARRVAFATVQTAARL